MAFEAPLAGGLAQLKVNGQRSIMIFDPKLLKMSRPSALSYYHGAVRSGSVDKPLEACDATIFKFNELEAEELYAKLTQVDHPCVIKALGFANGVWEKINSSFLAITPFDTTLKSYTGKHGPGADHNGRLTEDFITLIGDTIDGLEELHKLGFYCPDLRGDDIAVIRQSGLLSAKIWRFHRCDSGMEQKQMDDDWVKLGRIIVSVSMIQEVINLNNKIKRGQLKGKSIMKESALLTVRKKFENVLAFYQHISINYQKNPNQSLNKNNLKVPELCAANLKDDLDRLLTWTTPDWTQRRGHGAPIATKTLRGCVNQLRIFIEHEIFYIPEEMTRSLTAEELLDGKKKMDLEHQLQKESCGPIFRAVQRLVAELNVEY